MVMQRRVPQILPRTPEQNQFQTAIDQLIKSTTQIQTAVETQKKAEDTLLKILQILESLIKNGTLKITTADGDNNVRTNRIQVGTAAPQLIVAKNTSRKALTIRNLGVNPVYIGGPEVSTLNGFDILVNDIIPLDRNQSDIWAIASGGNATISIIEE